MKISCCMIVKDEEKHLPRCLESVEEFIDELAIVDTGSSDGTLDIIRKFDEDNPDIKVQLKESPWQKNFSLHRNESIQLATGHWLLFIDADEEIVTPDEGKGKKPTREMLVSFLKNQDKKGYTTVGVQMNDVQKGKVAMRFNVTKLFRSGTVKYENRIHNQPRFKGQIHLCRLLEYNHYGYDTTSKKDEEKKARLFELLNITLAEEPEKFETHFYLMEAYSKYGNHELATRHGETYLRLRGGTNQISPSTFYCLALSHMMLGNKKRALEVIQMGLTMMPHDLDLAMALSDYGAQENNFDLMLQGAQRYCRGYTEIQKDPSKKQGKFVFTEARSAYLFMLYRVMLTSLKEGMIAWIHLKESWDELPDNMKQECEKNLKNFGLEFIMDPKHTVPGAVNLNKDQPKPKSPLRLVKGKKVDEIKEGDGFNLAKKKAALKNKEKSNGDHDSSGSRSVDSKRK